jgi:hypothetical protein
VDTWDIISGSRKVGGDVLVYDDLGGHQAMDAVEALIRTAGTVEYVTPERSVAVDVGASPAGQYFALFADHDVATGVLHRLVSIEKHDGRLLARLQVEGAKAATERVVDTVVVEHGTEPDNELYEALLPGSVNLGQIAIRELLARSPQPATANPDGRYALYRVGDAVASRNIHAAILDAYRLCLAI